MCVQGRRPEDKHLSHADRGRNALQTNQHRTRKLHGGKRLGRREGREAQLKGWSKDTAPAATGLVLLSRVVLAKGDGGRRLISDVSPVQHRQRQLVLSVRQPPGVGHQPVDVGEVNHVQRRMQRRGQRGPLDRLHDLVLLHRPVLLHLFPMLPHLNLPEGAHAAMEGHAVGREEDGDGWAEKTGKGESDIYLLCGSLISSRLHEIAFPHCQSRRPWLLVTVDSEEQHDAVQLIVLQLVRCLLRVDERKTLLAATYALIAQQYRQKHKLEFSTKLDGASLIGPMFLSQWGTGGGRGGRGRGGRGRGGRGVIRHAIPWSQILRRIGNLDS
eukprot:762128-Hanusia_phi.AAC.14